MVLYAVALGILSVIGISEFVHRVDDLETRSLTYIYSEESRSRRRLGLGAKELIGIFLELP